VTVADVRPVAAGGEMEVGPLLEMAGQCDVQMEGRGACARASGVDDAEQGSGVVIVGCTVGRFACDVRRDAVHVVAFAAAR